MILNLSESLAKRCSWQTEHGIFVKFKKPSKTAVVLIAGVTISGTPCPRHIIVPFGAEAPSGHVAQAWAIPPPSWDLLSQWHRQQTRSVPRPNPATFLRDFTLYMTSKDAILWKRCLNYTTCLTLYCICYQLVTWIQLKLKINSCDRGLNLYYAWKI